MLRAAVHEAGHAICFALRGVPFTAVKVFPGTESKGETEIDAAWLREVNNYIGLRDKKKEQRVRDFIYCMTGGMAAELVVYGDYDTSAGMPDLDLALDYARYLAYNPQAYVQRAIAYSTGHLRKRILEVEAVAEALMNRGTVTQLEILECLKP